MQHFVIINEWANGYTSGSTIIGVTHSLEEAKEIFNDKVEEEREWAENHDYITYEDNDVDFDSGDENSYGLNHSRLYIQSI